MIDISTITPIKQINPIRYDTIKNKKITNTPPGKPMFDATMHLQMPIPNVDTYSVGGTPQILSPTSSNGSQERYFIDTADNLAPQKPLLDKVT